MRLLGRVNETCSTVVRLRIGAISATLRSLRIDLGRLIQVVHARRLTPLCDGHRDTFRSSPAVRRRMPARKSARYARRNRAPNVFSKVVSAENSPSLVMGFVLDARSS